MARRVMEPRRLDVPEPGLPSSDLEGAATGPVAERAIRGSIVTAVGFAVTMGRTLLLVPVLLHFWSAEQYGLWLALQSLFTLIIALDSGHQTYIGNEYMRLFPVNRAAVQPVLAAGLLGALLLGACELAIVMVLIWSGLLPWALGQAGSVLPREAALVLGVLTATWVMQGSAAGVIVRLYPAAGLYVRGVWWGIALLVLTAASIAGAAAWGYGILGAAVVTSVATLVYVAVQWQDVRRQFSFLYPFWKGASPRTAVRNISRSLVVTACALLTQLQQYGVIVTLSATLGIVLLPMYTTTRTLANVMIQAVSIVTNPLLPEMARFSALRQHEKLAATVQATWFVTGLPVNIGLCVGLLFVEPIYRVWTRGAMPFDGALFAWIAFAISVRCFGTPLNALIITLNELRAQTSVAVVHTIAVLVTAAWATPRFGLAGAGAAVAAGEIAGSLVMPALMAHRLMARTPRWILGEAVANAVAPSAIVGGSWGVVILGWMSPVSAVVCAVALLAGLYASQWSRLDGQIRTRLIALVRPGTRQRVPLGSRL